MQARDDSIAGFQMLQQQGPSPGQKDRLALLASQLEDTQAQLLATQVPQVTKCAAAPVHANCTLNGVSADPCVHARQNTTWHLLVIDGRMCCSLTTADSLSRWSLSVGQT